MRRKPLFKKVKYTGPPPARSAATPELSKELGLPWIEKVAPHKSNDLACAGCGEVTATELKPSSTPSGLARLCRVCT